MWEGLLKTSGAAVLLSMMLAPLGTVYSAPLLRPTPVEDAAIRDAVDDIPATGEPVKCDTTQEAATRALLRMSGQTPQNAPKIFRALDQLKAKNWEFRDMSPTGKPRRYGMTHAPDSYAVLHVGPTDDVTGDFSDVTGASFSSLFVLDTDYSATETQSLMIYTKDSNGDSDELIASGVGDTDSHSPAPAKMRRLPVAAESMTPGTDNNPDRQGIMAVVQYIGTAGDQSFCWWVRLDRDNVGTVDVKLDAPIKGPFHKPFNDGKPDRLVVCLNRGNPSEGDYCDYGPSEPNVHNEDLELVMPFGGMVTTLYPIYTGTDENGHVYPARPQGNKAVPGTLKIMLIKTEGGGCPATAQLAYPWQGFAVSGRDLVWQFYNPRDRTDGKLFLDMGQIRLCSDIENNGIQDWYMLASFYGMDDNNKPRYIISFGFGSIKAQNVASGKVFMPIAFQWGCVIEGTLITLADGREVPVEKLEKGDRLIGRGGKVVRVAGVSPGHDTRFIKLLDEAGQSVVVTPTHPVLTTDGMRLAKDLHPGDTVYGPNGPSRLREVAADDRKKAVRVYSVELQAEDGTALKNIEDRAFYAGSILIGDYTAQGETMRQASKTGRSR
jgi:hypothetical protein